MKDAAQDVAEDVTQDVAEDATGAAEDGSAKALVVARAIFHRLPRFPWATREGPSHLTERATHAHPLHPAALASVPSGKVLVRVRRARQGRGAGRCGGRWGGRATERGSGIGLRGPGGARLPRLTTTAAAAVFVQLTLR